MKPLRFAMFAWGMWMLLLAPGYGGASLAEAQTTVKTKLSLTSPQGGPSAMISHATFSRDGVLVGEFVGTLATLGGTASATVTVTDVPNEVSVTFATPTDGILTNYEVDAVDFAFDTPYFLPDVSAGGTIGPQPGDPSVNAFFAVSQVEVFDDSTGPTCDFSSPAPDEIGITVQDTGSGLAEINVSWASNVDVDVPPFDVGTTDPVLVIATIVDPNRSATVSLKVVDRAGNTAFCKRSIWRSRTIRWWNFSFGF